MVIPNDFQQSEQQRALDEINQVHPATQLLWLPVAAALAWLDGFDRNQWDRLGDGTLGDLVVVHCDWGQLQCSRLELQAIGRASAVPVVPARRRPVVADKVIPGFGWNLIESGGSLETQWERVFASEVDCPIESLIPSNVAAHPADLESRWLRQLTGWSVKQQPIAPALEELISHLGSYKTSPFGVLVVGDFAKAVASEINRCCGSGRLRIRHPVACFAGVEGEQLLARGAAVHLARQAADEVSYYDSLPEIELFIDRRGTYEWISVLGDDELFVRGGLPWERGEPIVGFEMRRGSSQVKLVLAHEEYEGVRELISSFDHSHEHRTPVTLHVSCTPAQGNAKLRLLTEPLDGRDSQEVQANWQRMTIKTDPQNRPINKEEYLKCQPRAFPELLPRLASVDKWRVARLRLQRLIRRVENEGTSVVIADRGFLNEIKSRLMQKDQKEYPQDATAIGSDFRCPLECQQTELEQAVACLLNLWHIHRHDSNSWVTVVIRSLGYLSVDDPEFQNWLVSPDVRYSADPKAVEHTCGLTLRDPSLRGPNKT